LFRDIQIFVYKLLIVFYEQWVLGKPLKLVIIMSSKKNRYQW